MKYTFVSAALAVCTNAYAISGDVPTSYEAHDWRAPGPGDGELIDPVNNTERPLTIQCAKVRAPCPMLNTLANHGYLPRNGKGISKVMAVEVLSDVLNWDVSVVNDLYDFAQPTNPNPNATTIDLNHLTTHNILEHDGSLR
jgi:hypothetical protein